MSSAEPNNLNVSPSIIPSSPSPLPPENCSDPRDVSGNGFNRFDPKYISIGPKATRNPLGSAQSSVNKCATLRHGGRYGNSASKFSSLKGGPQVPVVIGYKNPQPPSVATVCNEFGSFGSATLDRRTTSTFGGGSGGASGGGVLNNINESGSDKAMFTIEGSSSTFGRPIGNNQNKIYMEGKQAANPGISITSAAPSPKPISILNQPLPDIPHSALNIDAHPPMVTANTNQPLSAANLNHYQISNGPKSSFSMTSQLLQSGGGGGPLNSINGNPLGVGNYPLKSSMKQQPNSSLPNSQNPAINVRPSIQQAPLPPPPVQQPKPQMFSSINSTKTLPPQLPPKNRHKEPTMVTLLPNQQQQRQTLPNSKSQSQMTQFNKSNPQYATFMGYSENNNNKVVDSGDKARLIQQYYQETSNMRNNNNGMGDYGTNTKIGSQTTSNRMSYQTLPHQPAKFSQQQQQAIMAHQRQQYSQFAGGMQNHQPQQQLQPHPNYNSSGKMISGHNNSVGTQVRHGGAGGGGPKVDRNSNIEQMTYYRSLQRGAAREAGSANNDLYSVSFIVLSESVVLIKSGFISG